MDPEVLEALRRDSGLRVDSEGVFHFHAGPVQNDRVQDLFHRGLAVRADGEVTLTVGRQWAYVRCDTVARFVTGVSIDSCGLALTLRTGERVEAADPRVAFGPDDRVYVWETPGAAPAVLTRRAHHQLVDLLQEDGLGAAQIDLGSVHGARSVEVLSQRPAPGDRRPPS